jgi:hypothetical protein
MTDAEELERLRARVAELEAEVGRAGAAPPPSPPRPKRRWQSVVSAILLTLACVLAPLSVTAVWANTQVSDTSRYVETVTPLASDPAVQSAIADDVTNTVLGYVNVKAVTTQALTALSKQVTLPPLVASNLQALAVPITNGVESFTRTQVGNLVASPQFATLWVQVNRVAHEQLVKLLEGNQGGAVSAQNNTVTLNLAPIIAKVKQRLVASGFSLASNIPTVNKSFVLVRSDAVTKAQGIYRLLNTLGVWLPIITLILFAAGIYLAKDKRRALGAGALGVVGGMLVLGLGLVIARLYYLNAVPPSVLPQQAAGDVFDTLVRFLRYGLRAVGVLALVVALGAFFTGPSPTAVRTRSGITRGIGSLRGGAESAGLRTGVVGSWTFAHKRMLRVGTVILWAVVLVFWSRPTVAVVLWLTVAALVVLVVIEFLGRPPAEPAAAAAPGATPGPGVPRQMERVPVESGSDPAQSQPQSHPQSGQQPPEKETTPHG